MSLRQYSCCIDDLVVRELSTAAEILTYSLPTQASEATIGDGTIEVTVANSTDFDVDLTPTYTISENAEISDPVVTGEGDVRTIAYTVTAEAGNTKDWTVRVTKAMLVSPLLPYLFQTLQQIQQQQLGNRLIPKLHIV